MRLTSNGQLTIAFGVREKARLLPHYGSEFDVCANGIELIRRTVIAMASTSSLRSVCERARSSTDERTFRMLGTYEFMNLIRV